MHDPHHPVLARTLRGIESIADDEVRSRLGVESVQLAHRELRFRAPLTPALLELGTVDDVFLVSAEVDGVTRQRESLGRLASVAADLDLLAQLLDRSERTTFDVTASFLGRRNYSRFELEDALGRALAEANGWTYVPRHGELSLRAHVVGSTATVAARIARRPLHRRAYRVATLAGSVHPPLARALVLLAGQPFVDPFCGAGTIPIEAALAGIAAAGSDLDARAVEAARRNAAAAGLELPFAVADAAGLADVDCVVTNPPWGRTVQPWRGNLPRARRLVLLTAERPAVRGVVHQQAVRVHGAVATVTIAERA